jgi:hypothetical protein
VNKELGGNRDKYVKRENGDGRWRRAKAGRKEEKDYKMKEAIKRQWSLVYQMPFVR